MTIPKLTNPSASAGHSGPLNVGLSSAGGKPELDLLRDSIVVPDFIENLEYFQR